MIAPEIKAFYEEHGYAVARGLFSPEEVAQLRQHFMELRAAGTYPGDMVADVQRKDDPLQKYPRMIHMHRWDETTMRWLLDARLAEHLTEFLGHEPYAVQSMIYFKPPGARGQAVHQDNFYLRAKPGTCMAAWLALDRCNDENGCMRVVPVATPGRFCVRSKPTQTRVSPTSRCRCPTCTTRFRSRWSRAM
jgi:ectoine hydroxylase-related dioxygenase (phytanoyl-CoA dioxygenase family)